MKVGVVSTGLTHQVQHAQALCEGLGKHQIETTIYPEGVEVPEPVVACWGWRIGKPLLAAGKRVLVMERGFIDRLHWTSLGWDGLNGYAARAWSALPHRGTTFLGRMQRWAPGGSYVLIIGQVSGDAAVGHVSLPLWYAEAVRECAKFGLPIKFRPHPVALEFGEKDPVAGAESIYGSLSTALAGAAVVVTFNSNTGVDALMAGKPTICRDRGSMAWPIASHDWEIQTAPDRVGWLESLASAQFSLEEIRSGYAWDVVKDSQTLQ